MPHVASDPVVQRPLRPEPLPAARERPRTNPARSKGCSIQRPPIRRARPAPNAPPGLARPIAPTRQRQPTAARRAPKHAARAKAPPRVHPIRQSPRPPRIRGRPRMANPPNPRNLPQTPRSRRPQKPWPRLPKLRWRSNSPLPPTPSWPRPPAKRCPKPPIPTQRRRTRSRRPAATPRSPRRPMEPRPESHWPSLLRLRHRPPSRRTRPPPRPLPMSRSRRLGRRPHHPWRRPPIPAGGNTDDRGRRARTREASSRNRCSGDPGRRKTHGSPRLAGESQKAAALKAAAWRKHPKPSPLLQWSRRPN